MPRRIAYPRIVARALVRSTPFRQAFASWRRRRVARECVRALLRRGDDHLLNDMGITREELRARFALWDES